MDEIYFNHLKAPALHKEALQAFTFHAEKFASSFGVKGAEKALRSQRYQEAILARLGARAEDKLYCFLDLEDALQRLFFSHYVHSIRQTGKNHILFVGSAFQGIKECELLGCVIKHLPLSAQGSIAIDALRAAINPRVSMISLSLCDWGVIQPIAEIGAFCKKENIQLHVDVGAAIGKIPVSFHKWGIDFLTGSGAPLGIAWLIGAENTSFALVKENPLPSLALLSKSLEISIEQMDSIQLETAAMRTLLEERICQECPGAKVLFAHADRLPNVSVISFPTIYQEALLFFLNRGQLYVEEVDIKNLMASGIDPLTAQGALLFALSSQTTELEVSKAVEIVKSVVNKLQKVSFLPPLGAVCKPASLTSTIPYSRKLVQSIENSRHAGAFSSQEGDSKGMRCAFAVAGSVYEERALRLSLLIDETDGVIADAKFQAYGPPLLLGILEATCSFLVRKNLGQMARLTAEIIEKQLQDRGGEKAFGNEGNSFVNFVIEAIEQIEEQCQDLLDKHFEPPTPLSPVSQGGKRYLGWEILSKEEKLAIIEEIVASDIRPYIELDEGGITVMDLIGNEVVISYQGACTTCYASTGSTLQAIQTILQEKVSSDLTVRPDLSVFRA